MGQIATVMFDYDNRGRLISEVRMGQDAYNLSYQYDQVGNRIKKIDHVNIVDWIEVDYTYDYEDPTAYLSDNNRLMEYTTSECTSGQTMMMGGGGAECTAISETYYYYNIHGNVKQVVTKDLYPDPREKQYTATRLGYAKNGQAVTFAAGEEWNDENDYSILWGREFRYDGARQRYLNRVLDPGDLMLEQPVFTALSETWSDYDGDGVYADFTVNGGTATTTRWYELGIGKVDDVDTVRSVSHYHDDLIGTTRFMTDAGGAKIEDAAYTAFGERISGTPRRYGYAGAWGYQTDITPGSSPPTSDMPFLHVGHRYYDPATGRFLQRDPIGIGAGLNVYAYVRNGPTIRIDPDGLVYRDAAGKFARAPWWRRTVTRWGPIGVCGWVLIEFTERIVVPAIDRDTDRREREGYDRINNPRPPRPRPQRPPLPNGDERNDPCVGPMG